MKTYNLIIKSEMCKWYITLPSIKMELSPKSDSTHHFFRNACTKSGSLRFSREKVPCRLVVGCQVRFVDYQYHYWMSMALLLNVNPTVVECLNIQWMLKRQWWIVNQLLGVKAVRFCWHSITALTFNNNCVDIQ
jgi:hypothetical protein